MTTILALSLIFLAGILNGSFALPTKYITRWKFEHIWLNFSFWGFVIVPWLIMLYLVPQILQIYTRITPFLLLVIMAGGLFYGAGQVCFAFALDIIGIGLGFAINLGVGIILGFAMPLIIQHPDKVFTKFGLLIAIGAMLTVAGLVLASRAGKLRDQYKLKNVIAKIVNNKKSNFLGIMFAVMSGISSASQNFVFSYTHSVQDLAITLGATSFAAANVLWPLYLLFGFIPYASYMFYLHYKHGSFNAYHQRHTVRYCLFTMLMGILTCCSLFLYAKASQLIGALGPVIGWPIFMVVVIIVSSLWGWRFNEWQDCGAKAKSSMGLALVLFILAVIVLGYSSIQV